MVSLDNYSEKLLTYDKPKDALEAYVKIYMQEQGFPYTSAWNTSFSGMESRSIQMPVAYRFCPVRPYRSLTIFHSSFAMMIQPVWPTCRFFAALMTF